MYPAKPDDTLAVTSVRDDLSGSNQAAAGCNLLARCRSSTGRMVVCGTRAGWRAQTVLDQPDAPPSHSSARQIAPNDHLIAAQLEAEPFDCSKKEQKVYL